MTTARSRSVVLAMLTLSLAAVPTPSRAQQTAPRLASFLTKSIGLDGAQLAAVERGEIVVKSLTTGTSRDVAVFGIVTLDASRSAYARSLREFRSSLRTPTRQRFGLFGASPTAADLEGLTIDRREAEDLKKCKPGSCDFKLPATEMQELRSRIDWSAAAPETEIAAYARRRLAEYVAAYRASGDSAMVVYDDNGNVRASSAFGSLMAQSPYVYQYAPSLASYLASYPRGKPDGAEEAIYWAEDLAPRLRKVHSVNHVVLYTPPELSGATLMATKQLYADHYFEAAFDLTTLIDRAGQGASGSYLIVLRRFRFDNLPSGGLLNIRGRVIGSLQDQLRGDLERHRAAARTVGR